MANKRVSNRPQFSIITVCYNAQDYLEETIKSVIRQEYKNYEYIIIDGGSTDGTNIILEEFSDHIDILISEHDNGIYDAMNKGLRIATGRFVNFLNTGDTLCHRNTLQNIYDKVDHNIKVVSGDFILVNQKTNLRKYIVTKKLLLKSLKRRFSSCHQAIFIDLKIAPEFDTSYEIQADYLWAIESVSSLSPSQILKIDMPIIYYSQEGKSFNSSKIALRELFLLQKSKFGWRVFLNIDVYFVKILSRYRNEFIYKKFSK